MIKTIFCGSTLNQAEELLQEYGFAYQDALKVVTNFYRRGIHDFSEMENIPKTIRRILDSHLSTGLTSPINCEISADRSEKYLFVSDKVKMFETVIIPDRKRKTVCLSTQSGCRMGCPFCLTGRSGFRGDLTSGEIINQVLSVPGSEDIDHVVFMGMGEPMDNLDEVLKACEILVSDWGLAISPQNVTVSTVGITPSVRRFLEASECNLTLSLFSPFPDERAEVIPAEKLYPATGIVEMMKTFPVRKKRRFTIAYVMIGDVNDTESHLHALIKLLKGTSVRVNLLPYHTIPGDRFMPSAGERMYHFMNTLMQSGISASIRRSRGADISAACGLLASGLGKI